MIRALERGASSRGGALGPYTESMAYPRARSGPLRFVPGARFLFTMVWNRRYSLAERGLGSTRMKEQKTINRREFVRKSALGAAASTLSPSMSAISRFV